MAFEWRADESAARGVRRILRKEVKKALESLEPPPGTAADVHDARKRFKKVRAVLKLIRPAVGESAYRAANGGFRDAGRPLTEVRDAKALVETADELGKARPAEVPGEALRRVRDALHKREQEVRREVLERQGAQVRAADAVKEAWRRLRRRPLHGGGWAVFGRGLKETYRRGLDAFAGATAEPTTEHLHEWRKRAKDFFHQVQLFRPARPEALGELADEAHRLTDLLGDDHNLAVLRGLIADGADWLGGRGGELLPAIDRRREELQAEARRAGDRVYCYAQSALARRVKRFWKEWRASRSAPAAG